DATTMGVPGPATRPVALSWPPKPEELFDVWARDLGRSRPLAHLGAAPVAGLSVMPGAMLRPIAVPLMASGLEPGVLEPLAGAFSAGGFLPVAGQAPPLASTAGEPARAALAPGDAVGVSLLSGD